MRVDHSKIEILSKLTQLSTVLYTTRDLRKALNLITVASTNFLQVSACTVKVLNERRNKLEIYSQMGLTEDFINKIGPYGMFRSALNQKAIEGETVMVEDTQTEEVYNIPQELLDEGIRSIICLPLTTEDQVVGVLSVYNNEPMKLDKREMAFLKYMGIQGGAVIYSYRRFQRMETLMNMAKNINSSLDLDYVLKEIVVQAARTMKVRSASLRLLEETTNSLVFKTSFGLSKKYLENIPQTLKQSPIDRIVLEEKKIVEVEDMTIDPRVIISEAAADEGLSSMLCVPLMVQDRAMGILKIYTTNPTHFTDEEKNFLMAMAEISASAIRNAALYEKLHSLYLVTSSLSATIELDRVMELITIHAADYLKAMGAQILLWDKEKKRFTARSIYKMSEKFIYSIDMNKDWSALEGMKGNTVIVSRLDEDDRIEFREAAKEEDIHSLISVPLKSMDRILGILQVYCKQARNFTSDELEFITAIANHGAVSIENAKMHEHFKSKYEELVDDIYIWHDWTSYVIRS